MMPPWPPPGIDWAYHDEYTALACGDCREVLPRLAEVDIDLCLTDPPYKIITQGAGIGSRRKYLSDIRDFTDTGCDYAFLHHFTNWIVFCSKDQLLDLMSLAEESVPRWMLCTWNKPNPTPLSKGNYLPDIEYIIHGFQSGACYGEYADKSRYFVYPHLVGKLFHPNEKPLPLITKLLKVGGKSSHLTCDPFAGSGTTLRAAKDLGRRCIGIEIEPKYVDVAIKRLRQEVLPFGG